MKCPSNNRAGAPYQGHFLCLGRWGEPSPGEINKGIPDHGEIANIQWQIIKEQRLELMMETSARLEGLHIERQVRMEKSSAGLFCSRKGLEY
ncbi:MAG: hypothetical protein WDO19_24765 [Bacteroidota bacterium]